MNLRIVHNRTWDEEHAERTDSKERKGVWETPHLIKLNESQEALKKFVRAVRVIIVPAPEPLPPAEYPGHPRGSYGEWLDARIKEFLPHVSYQIDFPYLPREDRINRSVSALSPGEQPIDPYGYVDDGTAPGPRTVHEALKF